MQMTFLTNFADMKEQLSILRSAILAGLCISIGCVVNLRVGGIGGAVLSITS